MFWWDDVGTCRTLRNGTEYCYDNPLNVGPEAAWYQGASYVTALFDSLAHPTISGRWLTGGWEQRAARPSRAAPHGVSYDASIEILVQAMERSGFAMACAVGLAGIENYDHRRFADLCRPFPQLIPIAGVNPTSDGLETELDLVASLQFRGIKLHPRISSFSLYDTALSNALQAAASRDLVVFLCTYAHSPAGAYPQRDPLYGLARAVNAVPHAKIILLHGGDIELMRYSQLARHSPNLLLDVSFTMMKYRGSSLDLDLKYLFKHFNKRLCIGVDYPEYSHAEVRDRFEDLAQGLTEEERHSVGYRNLASFLAIAP